MCFDGGFHFLGEDLLSTGVDGDGVTPVYFDHVVCRQASAITRNYIANSVNNWICLFGLCFVMQIAQG